MAPEVALRKPYSEKTDVYSFGIMVWQMARDRVPFKGLSRDEFMQQVVLGGERPQLDKAWPGGFSSLLTACWHANPQTRPSFESIVPMLDKLAADQGGSVWPRRGKAFGSAATTGNVITTTSPSKPKKDTHSTWF